MGTLWAHTVYRINQCAVHDGIGHPTDRVQLCEYVRLVHLGGIEASFTHGI